MVVGVALYFARGLSRPIARSLRDVGPNRRRKLRSACPGQPSGRNRRPGLLVQQYADQLSELINHLEDRVSARTRDLQIAADVSRQITTVLDIDQLLQQVVTLTTQSFNLYAALTFRLTKKRTA